MNTAIKNIVDQYGNSFMDMVAEKFGVPMDQLQEMWKENMKKKLKTVRKARGKRTPTAYHLFCKDHRTNLREAHPDMTFGEVSKELARMWSDADDDMKAEYKERSFNNNQQPDVAPTPAVDESQVLVGTMIMTQGQGQKEEKESDKPTKPTKRRMTVPDDLNEQETRIWNTLVEHETDDLKNLCKQNGIKPIPRSRNDMIRSIVAIYINAHDDETQDED